MNRRHFLELLGMATVGGHIAYSFPSVIVPRNIYSPAPLALPFSHADSSQAWVDFYRQQLIKAHDWFRLPPLALYKADDCEPESGIWLSAHHSSNT